MTAGLDRTRLETLLLGYLTTNRGALDEDALVKQLARFTPAHLDTRAWRDEIAAAASALRAGHLVDDAGHVCDARALAHRLGASTARTWASLTDRVLPALALGVPPQDTKAHERLDGRDAWAAAIAARVLGLWTDGPPPSPAAVCDAFVWRQLGLAGKAKRVPPEIRALFIQRELATDAGAPDRLLRQLAAREVGAPRADLRALREALVRRWLAGETVTVRTPSAPLQAFAPTVREIARGASDGVFGDRKVFIASVWRGLRARPGWDELSLDDFRRELVRAHRRGELVLARADLVAAMDPALVAASEIRADGESFHFVVREAS